MSENVHMLLGFFAALLTALLVGMMPELPKTPTWFRLFACMLIGWNVWTFVWQTALALAAKIGGR